LPGAPGRRAGGVTATGTGDGVVLAGRAGAVEGVADAGYLLVTAAEAMGSTQYLVPVAAPGVELVPLRSIDLTRRFHDVVLADVVVAPDARVGPPGAGSEQDAHLRDLVTTLALGEIVGALDRAFAMTVEWTANRYSFGRPLASYQEIKHRMADLRTVLEAGAAVASRAAAALGTGAPDGRSWAAAGLAYLGRSGPEAIQDCIQLHGGIGVTADHDLHLYLRRATLDAHCFGGPADAARRLGGLVAEAEGLLAATGGGR
jgi:alkylation response protein AidB-like acyl-CoA dehydrogenase